MLSESPSPSPLAHPRDERDDTPEPTGMDQEQVVDNSGSIFPAAPKDLYSRYTARNLELARRAKAQEDVQLPFGLDELEPPNVDLIVADGSWTVFGNTWPIKEEFPTLEQVGLRQVYRSHDGERFCRAGVAFQNPVTDRRQSLQALLQALIRVYLAILDTLLKPPPTQQANLQNMPSDLLTLIDNLRLVAVNMHHLLNELRPVQAKETIIALKRATIQEKQRKTRALRSQCERVKSSLQDLGDRCRPQTQLLQAPSIISALQE